MAESKKTEINSIPQAEVRVDELQRRYCEVTLPNGETVRITEAAWIHRDELVAGLNRALVPLIKSLAPVLLSMLDDSPTSDTSQHLPSVIARHLDEETLMAAISSSPGFLHDLVTMSCPDIDREYLGSLGWRYVATHLVAPALKANFGDLQELADFFGAVLGSVSTGNDSTENDTNDG